MALVRQHTYCSGVVPTLDDFGFIFSCPGVDVVGIVTSVLTEWFGRICLQPYL